MDGYHIDRKNTKNFLGEGGYGNVWKAKSVVGNKEVAVKEVQIKEHTKKFIEREKNLMKACNHKNVITFYDAILVGSVMNFILEFCYHGNLNNFFKGQEHRVSFEQCLQYMENIASGVKHLHDQWICHRDLKPSNILVQREGNGEANLKVADFGLARGLSGSSSPASLTANTGTAGWQAPEMPRSTKSHSNKYDLPVDIFPLGLLFLAMLRHLAGKNLESLRGMLKYNIGLRICSQ